MSGTLGDIKLWAGGERLPSGWMLCAGQSLSRDRYSVLFSKLAYRYGNEGIGYFRLPDLRGFTVAGEGKHRDDGSTLAAGQQRGQLEVQLTVDNLPAHTHTQHVAKAPDSFKTLKDNLLSASTPIFAKPAQANFRELGELAVSPTGEGLAHTNVMPYTVINFIICVEGSYNAIADAHARDKAEDQFLIDGDIIGTIQLSAGTYTRSGFLLCDGRQLSLRDTRYLALFSIIGTRFGGDGINTFQLPDMRKRIPVGENGAEFNIGDKGGEYEVELSAAELPKHSHPARVQASAPNSSAEDGIIVNMPGVREFARATDKPASVVMFSREALSYTGGGKAHQNQQSYVELCFAICVEGEYPA